MLSSVKTNKRIPKHRRHFGDAIRKRRIALDLSQEQLAEGVGCHRNYMGRIERGEQNITLDMMVRVAKALGVKMAELVHEANL